VAEDLKIATHFKDKHLQQFFEANALSDQVQDGEPGVG